IMTETLKQGRQNPNRNILIINSNTNQKASRCRHLLDQAKKSGFQTETYRLHNFFPNLHGVREGGVFAAYIKLNENRVAGEIHIEAVRPATAEQLAKIEQMQAMEQQPLIFDEARQTFVSEEYLQHGGRNFTAKASRRYPDLRVLKYARSVFYNNRFDDALLEMRGMVIDAHNQIIVRPFKKVFNYSERIAKGSRYPIEIDDERLVNAVVKVNGFLGCCTYVSLPENHPSHGAAFDGKVLYSTTGSLDSAFADMTAAHCKKYEALFRAYPNHTFLFEITDENDVHIIRETLGETLIGCIDVATGRQFTEAELDAIGKQYHIRRPEILKNITFGDLKGRLKTVEHEGFMVFDAQNGEMLFKLKSPYYLISKFFGRSNEGNIGRKLDKRHVDEEFYPLIDHIRDHRETFNAMSELDKIAFIQTFLRQM
ncbi:MAG: RNA ligase, partial [Neisseria sp.]|nr:RNA ligase [Neisseria sp.]